MGFTHKITWPLTTWSCEVTWQTKTTISPLPVFMATKHGRMATLEKLLLIKLYDRLIMWSSKITWQTKANISPLPQYLRPFLRVTLSGSFPLRNMALKLRGLARSRNKLKTCLHYHNAYGQQTLEGGDIQWGALTHDPSITYFVRSHDKLNALYLH